MPSPIAIVTGASSGLGRATALRLVQEGYQVLAYGRNTQALERVQFAAKDFSGKLIPFRIDLSKPGELEGAVARSLELAHATQLDLLIHCAAFGVTGHSEVIPLEAYQRCWQVNFFSVVALTQQAMPFLAKRRGKIVNVTSGVARRALPYHAPYSTSKAALNSFTESFRVELRDSPVRLLLFSPGPILSGFHDAVEHFGPKDFQEPPVTGKTAAWVAGKLMRAIEQDRTHVTLGVRAALAYHLNYWAPALVDRLLARAYRKAPATG